MKSPVIIKFGGTSVSTKDSLYTIVEIVNNFRQGKPILVVSAITGVTDALLALSTTRKSEREKAIAKIYKRHEKLVLDFFTDREIQKEILRYISLELNKVKRVVKKRKFTSEHMDQLVSFGEILSSFIVAKALSVSGIRSVQIIADQLIITDNNYTHAEFIPEKTEIQVKKKLLPLYKKGIVPVVTGFIGATERGKITTLGRGGSDYSASIIAYSLKAKELQIWTDVNGIYTADPRIVKNAMLISTISYKEAAEMATFGAKVLHPKTIKPAVQRNIPVKVLNTFHPTHSGTQIIARPMAVGVKAVSFKKKTIEAHQQPC